MSKFKKNPGESAVLQVTPEIRMVGGLAALRGIGNPADVMHEAKGRLFAE